MATTSLSRGSSEPQAGAQGAGAGGGEGRATGEPVCHEGDQCVVLGED